MPVPPAALPDDLLAPKKGIDGAKLVIILGITMPLAVGLGIWIGTGLFAEAPQDLAPPASASEAVAAPEPSATPPPTLLERAANGEFKAQDALKKKAPDDRTSAETLAIAEGRTVNKRLALEGFAAQLAKKPDLLTDKEQLQRLIDFLEDRETTNQAARVVTELPGGLGADILYEVWVATRGRNETTMLAEDLVYSTDVREKASEALKVALDLRAAEDAECEPYVDIVQRAAEHGDGRSLHLLGKLLQKRGCGPKKLDDCFACLRPLDDDDEKASVLDAIRAVRTRKAPRF